jgi:hypothetical protein
MSYVNVGIGLLVLILLASIFIPLYMENSLAANTTGWNSTLVQLQNNFIPLLAAVGILMLVIFMAFIRKK